MKLKPADIDAVLERNLANIVRKAAGNRTLTAKELAILEAHKSGEELSAAAYVTNLASLAEALGMSRQALNKARKKPGFPGPDQAGRYHVADHLAWRSRTGAGLIAPAPGEAAEGGAVLSDIYAETLRKKRGDADEQDIKVARLREELIEVSVVAAVLAKFSGAIRQVIMTSKLSKGDRTEILRQLADLEQINYADDLPD